ncbi:peptidase M23 [Streptomyces sp. NPDC059894]|uniref:peptidase M23 n=1 Tax=unclassified Streptomyces TaxID=2593676 RepID=UPI00364DAA5B
MTSTSPSPRTRLRRAVLAGAAATGAALSLLTAAPAPAQAAPDTTQVYVWATNVNMRSCAGFECEPYDRVRISRMHVTAYCQSQSDVVRDSGYANDWWVQVDAGGPRGWISAVYVRGGRDMAPVPGVSQDFEDCF